MRRCLIVAYLTMGGRELTEYLVALAGRGQLSVHVVVPVHEEPQSGAYPVMFGTLWTPTGDEAGRRAAADLDGVLARLKRVGIEATGEVAAGDPILALVEAEAAGSYDELIISTLPPSSSRWLRMDVPHRARRRFGARVTAIVNEPGRYAADVPAAKPGRQAHIRRAEQESHVHPVELLVVDCRRPLMHDIDLALAATRIRARAHRAASSTAAVRLLETNDPRIEVVAVAWGLEIDENTRLLQAILGADHLGARPVVVVGQITGGAGLATIAHDLGASAFVSTGPHPDDNAEVLNAVLLEHMVLGRSCDHGAIGGTP